MTIVMSKERLILPEPEPEEAVKIAEGLRETPFYYGYRYVARTTNGMVAWEQVPLSPEDVLHPQLEDHVSQSKNHVLICHYLTMILRAVLSHIPGIEVLSDVPINWGVPGVKDHSPDVSVLADVLYPPFKGVYYLKKTGGRPLLVIEVTSDSTRHLDVASKNALAQTKFKHYAIVGVLVYIIIDEARRKPGHPPVIYGYALTPTGEYTELACNSDNRLWLAPVHLWLGTVGERVMLFDDRGHPLEDYADVMYARKQAEERVAKAEEERKLAEERAAKADAERKEEAQARKQAEERAAKADAERKEEAQARKQAEERAAKADEKRKQEAQARKQAEEERKQAEEERKQAEERLHHYHEQQKALARTMLTDGLEPAVIATYTGLTVDEVAMLER